MITCLIAALSALPFGPLNHIPMPKDSNEFDFVVLGDNRPAGAGLPPTSVFTEMLQEVATIHPAFVLSSGDLVYGNEESMAAYRKEFDLAMPLLTKLNVPFFNAPGNHEINDRPDLQAEYVKRCGDLYGSFDFGGCRFIAVCSEEAGHNGELSETQTTWLTSTVQTTEPTFVFLHRPLFPRVGNTEESASVKGATALHELFRSHNVKAVFQGHDHLLNLQEHDGIKYIISGGAGAPLDASPENGGFFHFLVVHIKDGKPTFKIIPAGSIQVVQDGNTVHVSNYSDEDLSLNDLTVKLSKKPSTFTAKVDKKGKFTDVPISIEKIETTRGGFLVHLKLPLTKHRQTVIEPI